jgi:Ca-activated chloride channel family protein
MTTLTVRPDRLLLRPDAPNRRVLRAEVVANAAPRANTRTPLNLAIALDRSGSMAGAQKFSLAMQAIERVLRTLSPTDRVSVVAFDSHVDVVVPLTPVSPAAVEDALRRLSEIGPRGNTDLFGGWQAGANELVRGGAPGALSRVLVLSDGLANAGVTAEGPILSAVADLLARGVRTSTLGVGADFDERLMTSLAVSGGGNSWFANDAGRIPELVQAELGEALQVVTPSARLVIEAPPDATVRCLHRFFTTQLAPGRTAIDLGALVSSQLLEVAIEVQFAVAPQGATRAVGVTLEGDEAPVAAEVVEFLVVNDAQATAQPRDVEVVRLGARAMASAARLQAVDLNRAGDLRAASEVLLALADRVARWARGDEELRLLARTLRHEADELSERRSPMDLKRRYSQSSSEAKGRDSTSQGTRRR